MYYEATTTKGIIIHINAVFTDCIKCLVWPDDCRKLTVLLDLCATAEHTHEVCLLG